VMEVEPTPAAAAAADAKEKIHLDVLTSVRDSQSQYGLRNDDYTRYRQYCCRRLRRIRKSVKFLHGKGHYKKKTLESKNVKNDRCLSIPLFNAERAWSYAMELKKDLSKDDDSRKQHHLLKRLKRAVKWSQSLQDLSKDVADDRTQLEAEAYATWMAGNEHMERSRWVQALKSHLRSKTLCEELAKVSDPEMEDRCNDMVKQLSQSIRLAKYHSKKEVGSADDMKALVNECTTLVSAQVSMFEVLAKENKSRESTGSTSVLVVGGRKITITNPRVQAQMLEAQKHENELASVEGVGAKIDALAGVIAKYTKASSLCRNDILQNEGAKLRTVLLDKKAEVLKLLKSYFDAKKARFKLERNGLLASKITQVYSSENAPGVVLKGKAKKERKTEESVIAAYDKVIENVQELQRHATEKELGELDALLAGYRALRCFYRAIVFEKVSKFAEAYVLYKRCAELGARAQKTEGALAKNVEEVLKIIPGRRLRAHALGVAANEKAKNTLSKSVAKMSIDQKATPLLTRLGTFDSKDDVNLTEFPVPLKSAPNKQLFFDVAYRSLAFASLDKRLEEEKAKSGGLLSSLGLW